MRKTISVPSSCVAAVFEGQHRIFVYHKQERPPGMWNVGSSALVPSFQKRGARTCSSIVFHPSRQQMQFAIIWPLMSLIIKVPSVINNLSIIAL